MSSIKPSLFVKILRPRDGRRHPNLISLTITCPLSTTAELSRGRLAEMAGAVRTGGKGTARRKRKAIHKTTTTDDKRLQSTLKRIVQASIPANTWVVCDFPQTKSGDDTWGQTPETCRSSLYAVVPLVRIYCYVKLIRSVTTRMF